MTDDYLTDTNIILLFLRKNDPDYADIRQSVESLKRRRAKLFTTPQNIAEFWNVCMRPASARGGLGLSIENAEHRIRLIERHFVVLPEIPEIYAEWKRLVLSHRVSGVNVYDARLIAAMNIHGIKNLITFNAKDFSRYPDINIFEPIDIK